jgi:hypothetical protein
MFKGVPSVQGSSNRFKGQKEFKRINLQHEIVGEIHICPQIAQIPQILRGLLKWFKGSKEKFKEIKRFKGVQSSKELQAFKGQKAFKGFNLQH